MVCRPSAHARSVAYIARMDIDATGAARQMPGGDRRNLSEPRIEMKQLRCFVAVAEELSFTRAAERLGISQPWLSEQVSRLEPETRTILRAQIARPIAGQAAILPMRSRGRPESIRRHRVRVVPVDGPSDARDHAHLEPLAE